MEQQQVILPAAENRTNRNVWAAMTDFWTKIGLISG
jgi:hypothetical protein